MVIAEPATTLTDYALAFVAFGLGRRLSNRESLASRRFFGASLLATAAAALTGGTYHGFAPYLGGQTTAALWMVTYAAIGLANLLILTGAAVAAIAPAPRRPVVAALVVRFAAYLALTLPQRQFRFVVYDYAVTLLLLLAFAVHGWISRRQPASAWIAAAALVSAAGAAIQHARVAPHPLFNHNDLFHVIQTVGVYLFYRGGRRLRDHGGHDGSPFSSRPAAVGHR